MGFFFLELLTFHSSLFILHLKMLYQCVSLTQQRYYIHKPRFPFPSVSSTFFPLFPDTLHVILCELFVYSPIHHPFSPPTGERDISFWRYGVRCFISTTLCEGEQCGDDSFLVHVIFKFPELKFSLFLILFYIANFAT